MVFGEVRVAAECFEYISECGVAYGICNQVYVFAIAAKTAVQEFERSLMDTDGGNGGVLANAFSNCIADNVLVFINDVICSVF